MILRSFYFTCLCAAFLCVGILVGTASSQMRHGDDDTLFFALHDAVTVTATRLPTALRDAPAAVDVYPAREIAALPARSLSDLLSLSSGASVRDYGGTGSLQLASLRGLGAEYTMVLLDGMRLNSAQNALVDVGQLSLDNVDRVEIVRGGLASLYGGSALGGVVNIVTARQRPPLAAGVGYGAFGWRQFSLAAGTKGAAGRAWADFRYEQRANDFGFT
ncbi:MAG: TonB-dependent receptor, partial [Bacteroidetes bacterium]|nr:TonB-dependent receptor [Bacteroidota bacterium]